MVDRTVTEQERAAKNAADALNDALTRCAMAGIELKLSIRTHPGMGKIAKCPQVKVAAAE